MRIKELQKTVNVAWSPEAVSPIYLAAGTAAQQLDNSFSTDSVLELYDINLSSPSYEMVLKGSQTSAKRFHKIIWSPTGISGGVHSEGLIVGGCDSGNLQIYSAERLLRGENALVVQQDKHTGPIRSLDYNPFQNNLLASAASESEILIWDLNNTTTPMTPGSKTQPFEDVQSVAWNKQVQHILASVFASRCVIWDLRKNEPIIKLSDSQSRVRWRSIQWHPEVATQLWLASEEDQVPVVQLWDLRYSTAPAKTLQIHNRGIFGMCYCPKDTEMIVSCGKDYKILCWNPKSELPNGEILSEVATTNQWYADITWCPKNPALIASTSLDGVVSLYSLFGGGDKQEQQSQNDIKLLDSFPGMDQFAAMPPPQQQQNKDAVNNDLKKPPKWLRKPIGASFAFGGKLVSFSSTTPHQISVTQVTTEPQLIEQTDILDNVLTQNNLADYCRQRADQQSNQNSRLMWYFLKSNFEQNPRSEMLNLLGYDTNDIRTKYAAFTKTSDIDNDVTNHMNNDTNLSGDANGQVNDNLFDSIAAGYKETTRKEDKKSFTYSLKETNDIDTQITEAILTGNLEAAVELCMENNRKTEAIIIANNAGPELLKRTQSRYLDSNETGLSHVISALITNNWELVVKQCSIDSWKEALVAALTHSTNEFSVLCERLGERLQNEAVHGDKDLLKSAIICYICAGSIDKLIEAWQKQTEDAGSEKQLDIDHLYELTEIVILLQKGVQTQGKNVDISGNIADLLNVYAKFLVGQGKLYSALTYIGDSTDERLVDLRERIYYAIGHKSFPQQTKMPFNHQQRQVRSNSSQFVQSNFAMPKPMPAVRQTQAASPWNLQPQQVPSSGFGFSASPIGLPPAHPPSQPSQIPTVAPPMASELPQPPRPSSVGSGGQGSSLHRSKYVLDPSVRSNQSTATSYFGQNTPYGGMGATPGLQYNNQMNSPAPVSLFQPQPQTNTSIYTPSQPLMASTPFNPQQTAPLPLPPTANTYDSNYMSQQQQAFPEPPPPLLARERNPTPPPGWNDPPAPKSRSRTTSQSQDDASARHAGTRVWEKLMKKKTKDLDKKQDANQNVAPITHPIFGHQEINQNIPNQQPPQQIYGGQTYPSTTDYGYNSQINAAAVPPPPQQSIYDPQSNTQQNALYGGYPTQQNQQFPPQSSYNPTPMGGGNVDVQHQWGGGVGNAVVNNQQSQQQQPIQRAEIAEPVKKPIPAEHIHIQTTFDDLRVRCILAANNPQAKRKLEDVAKRLEFLYDMLRESRLTPNTLQSLDELVKLVAVGDYANSVALHTQMISGADFSQIASFMPGIKVLLQSAIQMQVYLK